jgi:hypothetical protein
MSRAFLAAVVAATVLATPAAASAAAPTGPVLGKRLRVLEGWVKPGET